MKLRRAIAFAILLPLIGACGSPNGALLSGSDAILSEGPTGTVRVCDIREQPEKYLGAIVRVHAIYKSDHMYYSYLIDDSCASDQTIEVDHPLNTNGDKSVRDFFLAEDKECEKKGGSVCPIRWPIVVDVLIKKQPNERLFAEFKHVQIFSQ